MSANASKLGRLKEFAMVESILRRAGSVTFRRAFVVILIAEAITVFVAWLLVDYNIKLWLHAKAAMAVQVSQRTAALGDWSQIGSIPDDRQSPVGSAYEHKLDKLSQQYFLHDEGSVYLVRVEDGEAYEIRPGDAEIADGGKANQWERNAYADRATIYSPTPIIDDEGTYIAAYTPILRNSRVIGLVATEYDSAPLTDFKAIVATTFWKSMVPAVGISLVVSYVLAWMFVEPTEMLRAIADTARNERARAASGAEDEPWNRLTDREMEVAELAGQGLQIKEMAERLRVESSTVQKHLKNIKGKTDWSKTELGLQAQARRLASLPT